MRKNIFRTGICTAMVAALCMATMAGCGSIDAVQEATILDEMIPMADEAEAAPEITVNEKSVHEDANGWTCKYDPEKFVVDTCGPVTTFVYMGECAGTNMITATYTAGVKAEDAINEIGKNLGDKADFWQSTFVGTEDVPGYWVTLIPNMEGSGYGKTALARDYMEGSLVFEIDEHMGMDDMQNIDVSDALSEVIDSIEFPYES